MIDTVETNIALVPHGQSLRIAVREGKVDGTDLTPDIIEKACRTMVFQRGVAAIPHPHKANMVLIAAYHPVKKVALKGINWAVSIEDAGKSARQYYWKNPEERGVITELIERTFEAYLQFETTYWNLDSPHIWYEQDSFANEQGVRGFRRFTVGAIPLDEIGLGIAVDVTTAFFSEKSLAYYFELHISKGESKKRQQQFDRLTSRQKGQKGTLWYKVPHHEGKCYFESAPDGITCATTGQMVVRGKSYDSLYDYYRENYPNFDIEPNTRAVRVSFDGYGKPSWVAAECLFVRIMNDELPHELKHVDKIISTTRYDKLQKFWNELSSNPLEKIMRGEIKARFWQPSEDRITRMRLPDLLFRSNHRQVAPKVQNLRDYKQYFKARQQTLDEVGCYSTPPAMPRNIYLAVPNQTS
ncbi:MAG: hypothetical protein AAFQ07_06450, partial [Chloroflexota bacterium]